MTRDSRVHDYRIPPLYYIWFESEAGEGIIVDLGNDKVLYHSLFGLQAHNRPLGQLSAMASIGLSGFLDPSAFIRTDCKIPGRGELGEPWAALCVAWTRSSTRAPVQN
jgi:hypothetical protein